MRNSAIFLGAPFSSGWINISESKIQRVPRLFEVFSGRLRRHHTEVPSVQLGAEDQNHRTFSFVEMDVNYS